MAHSTRSMSETTTFIVRLNTPAGMPTSIQCPAAGVFGFSAASSDATTGYNLVTGLGSVDANKLAVALAATYVNFSVAPSLSSLSAAAGQSTSPTTITITPIKNYVGPATYSCPSGLPTGATCTFTTVNSTSSTLVINTPANLAAASNIAVTVQATDSVSGVAKTTTVSLSVSKTTESFSLTSSLGSGASLAVTQGQTSGAVNFTVTSSSTPPFVTEFADGVALDLYLRRSSQRIDMQLSSEQHNGCTVGFFDHRDDGSNGQAATAAGSWAEYLLRGPVSGTVGNCRDPRRAQAFAECHANTGVDRAA